MYGAGAGNLGLGMVQDNFLAYATGSTVYPADDSSYTSPSLLVTGRMATKMSDFLDAGLTALSQTRALTVTSVTDTHGHFQWSGDGGAAHPALFDRELFTFLPFQVNASRFVIPYYVMTRDVAQTLSPENFDVGLDGIAGAGASITAYDPIQDAAVPVVVNSAVGSHVDLTLLAADYPYLLIVQEGAFTPTPTPTASATFTITPTRTPTADPTPAPGTLQKVLWPCPQDGKTGQVRLLVKASGPLPGLEISLYSSAYTCVLKKSLSTPAGFVAGWTPVALAASGLKNGLYFAVAEAGGVRLDTKVYILR
jgi:hypothetical protein